MISKNNGLKQAVQTLVHAIPNIANVGLVSMIFYLIFAIFCVTFVKGSFYHCYYDHLEEIMKEEHIFLFDQNSIVNKFDCLNIGGEWINPARNYDNVLNALELLFSISLVNWMNNMFNVVDAVGVDK